MTNSGEIGVEGLGIQLPEAAVQQFGSTEQLQKKLNERVDSLIAQQEFTQENIRFVRSFVLPAASGSLKTSNELLERLRRAAQIWDVSLKQPKFSSHRPIIGPVIVGFKKALYPVISFFLADSLRQQRDFNAAVLRCLVEMARDERKNRPINPGEES